MAEKIFFTNFELKISGYGDSIYKSCELKLMLLPDEEKTRKECPQPNADDLPRDMREALLNWLGGLST